MSIDTFHRLYLFQSNTNMVLGEPISDYQRLFSLPAGSVITIETGDEYLRVEGGWMNAGSNISISSHGMIRQHKVYLKHIASE